MKFLCGEPSEVVKCLAELSCEVVKCKCWVACYRSVSLRVCTSLANFTCQLHQGSASLDSFTCPLHQRCSLHLPNSHVCFKGSLHCAISHVLFSTCVHFGPELYRNQRFAKEASKGNGASQESVWGARARPFHQSFSFLIGER